MATFSNPKPLIASAATVVGQASITFVSTGVGVGAITPSILGRVFIQATAEFANGTLGDGGAIAVYRNITGVPAAGTAVGTDTAIFTGSTMLSTAAGQVQSDTLQGFDTAGTAAAFYYVAIKAVTGGTVTAGNTSISVEEK